MSTASLIEQWSTQLRRYQNDGLQATDSLAGNASSTRLRAHLMTASGHLPALAVADLNVSYPNRNREQAKACRHGKGVPLAVTN